VGFNLSLIAIINVLNLSKAANNNTKIIVKPTLKVNIYHANTMIINKQLVKAVAIKQS